jgi:hypothetical protein
MEPESQRYRYPQAPREDRKPRSEGGGGAGGARTHDRRIMRSTAPCTTHASCTDDADHCTDGTHHAGIIWRAGPRTGPRPRRPCPFCSATVRNLIDGTASAPTGGAGFWWPTVLKAASTHVLVCCYVSGSRTSPVIRQANCPRTPAGQGVFIQLALSVLAGEVAECDRRM